ncbi:hypothetical protein LCGC14_0601810 [marine sediment metagenome]|uniref:Uncharacterized protein n=1 Tax=marine sediment metagenome TaxID=412755 RepID=A0A0F9RF18_9ZZZZ
MKYKELVADLFMLSGHDEGNYTTLPILSSFSIPAVEDVTEKAALISFEHGSIWIPKSQMRINPEGVIYLANWLYEKHFEPTT